MYMCLWVQLQQKSIQLISWAMKVRWPNKPDSLTEIQISFAPAEELFLGMPTLQFCAYACHTASTSPECG